MSGGGDKGHDGEGKSKVSPNAHLHPPPHVPHSCERTRPVVDYAYERGGERCTGLEEGWLVVPMRVACVCACVRVVMYYALLKDARSVQS